MRGINIRSWTAGAVKPAEDSPAGFIWFEGTLVNDLPIPMTGVVGLNAVSMIGAGASVSGKQRMTMGGSALKLMGNTADFKVKVDVPEIGAVGDKWKVALFSGNLLGQMPVYKKEVELTVLAMKVKPELPTKGGLVKTGKTTLRME